MLEGAKYPGGSRVSCIISSKMKDSDYISLSVFRLFVGKVLEENQSSKNVAVLFPLLSAGIDIFEKTDKNDRECLKVSPDLITLNFNFWKLGPNSKILYTHHLWQILWKFMPHRQHFSLRTAEDLLWISYSLKNWRNDMLP